MSALHTDSLFPKAVNNVMCFLMCVQWAAPAFWSVNLLTYPHQLLRRCNSRVLTLCGIWPVSSLSVAGEEGTIKHHTQWYNNVWRASDGELVSGTKGRAGLIIHESSAGAMQRRSICLYGTCCCVTRLFLLSCGCCMHSGLSEVLPLTRCWCALHFGEEKQQLSF